MSKRCRSCSPSAVRSQKKSKEVLPKEITHILDLNDDCFEAVFLHLDPNDLCAVKETCRRFDPLADDAFRRKYRGKILKFDSIRSLNTAHFIQKSHVSPKHLQMFGKFIYGLSVLHLIEERDSQLWQNICENCTQLKILRVIGCDLEHFIYPVDAEPHQLDFLDMVECDGNDEHFTRFLTYFVNIKRLRIDFSYWDLEAGLCLSFLDRNFEQLKEVTFRTYGFKRNFNNFMRLNPQIKKICAVHCLKRDNLDCIVQHCPNIESILFRRDRFLQLEEEIWSPQIAGLSRLNNLKELEFDCSQEQITSATDRLAEKNLLTKLGLSCGIMDMQLCRALCKMTNLKTLTLAYIRDIDADLLKKLMQKLELTEINIYCCEAMEVQNLLPAVKYSRSLVNLIFRKNCDLDADPDADALNESQFFQLVKAREQSGASFPLKLFLHQQIKRKTYENIDIYSALRTKCHFC